MKRLLVIVMIFFFLLHAHAQNKTKPEDFPWYHGKVILHTGDTISCQIRYSQMSTESLLQVQDGKTILTLSVTDVSSFTFFDEKKNKRRIFYTLPVLEDEATRSREFFMEYLYGNEEFSILTHKAMGLPYEYMEYGPIRRKSAINKRYLLDIHSGKMIPMSKENILELLQQRKPQILSYIESNSVKFKKVSDYINVLEYYASL